jgi:predicted AAA+ superfamily ATPase
VSSTQEHGYRQISPAFRGGITENYVRQALQANGVANAYWVSGNTAEVDFLIQDDRGRIIPIEVKSGDNVRSKSLDVFRGRYRPPLAVRLSTNGFGLQDGLMSVPLYAAHCLDSGIG